MHKIEAREAGSPDVLKYVDAPDPVPGPGRVLVEVAAAGLNFIDIERRREPAPEGVGCEGAGTVVALGEGVTDIAIGDRVAWSNALGSYAELVSVPAAGIQRVPDSISLEIAAALPLQGLTAHYLTTSSYPVRPGDTVLVHAGAGGVGLLLTQMATARGGRVISTVSSAEKERLSRDAGAVEVIRYDHLRDLATELPPLVIEAACGVSGGNAKECGVHAVYDGVGMSTFNASLACLRRRGTLVLFGGSSGQVHDFDVQRLDAAGSLSLTRPTLNDFISDPAELAWRSRELFDAVLAGTLRIRIGARFPLSRAADAQRALESRHTNGKVILIP